MKNISLKLFADEDFLFLLLGSVLIFLVLCIVFHLVPERKKKEVHPTSSLDFVSMGKANPMYAKKDYFSILAITCIYAFLSLHRLGNTTFPVTTWQPQKGEENQSFILELTDSTFFNNIQVLYEEGDNNSLSSGYQLGVKEMTLEGSNDLQNWATIQILDKGNIFTYQTIEGEYAYKYIRITAASSTQTLTEIAFIQGDTILPVKVYEDAWADSAYPASLVIDEQDKVVVHPTYYDEAYFDEIYHPRNAKEISDGQAMYASVHPLLGTNIMALFIHLFGFSPFVYRLPGALFGIVLLPLLYILLKRLFSSCTLCTFGTLLCAFDFMHLTTSRIATLEPYSVFFILLMFYWMIRYYQTSFYSSSLSETLRLLLACGISMGLGISTKWTACYSAVGLAVLLFTSFFIRFQEYRKCRKLDPATLNKKQKEEARHILEVFPKYFWITIGCCFLFFLLIPAAIYCLSYLPDHVWRNEGWSIANVWKQNMYMYNYHTNLHATHPYQSTWYMWLVDARPIWYYSGVHATGTSYSISCFSNPLLTWAGLPCVLYVFCRCFRKDRTAWCIAVGYMSALMPWMLVDRCVFAYHFYPTSFFTILAIVYCAERFLCDHPERRKYIFLFEAAYIFLFILFLPVTAGFGTNYPYIHFLEWFPSWYFG